MNRWFDLSGSGAKLDRIVDPNGLAYLSLSFSKPFDAGDKSAAIGRAGWVVSENGKSIQNHASFRDLSEIGTALQPVFGEETVASSIVAREKLRQGEVLEGVDRPLQVELAYVAGGVQRMADHAQDRVFAQIEAARERLKEKNLASLGPSGGRMSALVEGLSELTGGRPSRIAAQLLHIRHDAEMMKIVTAAAGGSDVPTAKSDVRELLSSLDDQDGLLTRMEERLKAIYGDIPQMEQVLIGEYMGARRYDGAVVVDFDRVRSNLAEDITVGVRDTVRGYKFEISPDTTTMVGREMQARLEQTLDFIGQTFGMDPSDLLTEKTRFRVVQKAGLSDLGEKGGYSATSTVRDAEGDVEFQAGAIVFRPDQISVALHEIGHGFDSNLGDDESKYEAIFGETGLRDAYAAVVSEALLLDGMNEDYRQYLLSDEEMFARYFENALRQHCVDQNGDLDAIGGTAISGFKANYAPLERDKLDTFIEAVRDYGRSIGVVPEAKEDRTRAPQSAAMGAGI